MALSSQARLGSLSTRNAVRTQFYNHTSLDVAILWLDYDGNEVRKAGRDSNTTQSGYVFTCLAALCSTTSASLAWYFSPYYDCCRSPTIAWGHMNTPPGDTQEDPLDCPGLRLCSTFLSPFDLSWGSAGDLVCLTHWMNLCSICTFRSHPWIFRDVTSKRRLCCGRQQVLSIVLCPPPCRPWNLDRSTNIYPILFRSSAAEFIDECTAPTRSGCMGQADLPVKQGYSEGCLLRMACTWGLMPLSCRGRTVYFWLACARGSLVCGMIAYILKCRAPVLTQVPSSHQSSDQSHDAQPPLTPRCACRWRTPCTLWRMKQMLRGIRRL